MGNEIYNSSNWGNGVCDNTIDWGIVYKDNAGCTPSFTNTKSVNFDGVDDYVGTSASISGTDFTLSYWINANGSYASFQRFHPVSIRPSNNAANQSMGYLYTKGGILYPSLQAYDSTDTTYSTWSARDLDFEGAGWHNIIWTFNNTTKATHLYVDGIAQTFTNFGGTATTSYLTSRGITFSTINIGATWTTNEYWSGNVDEVSFFNSVLSSGDITSIYNSGTPANLTDLSPIAWYRMGDSSTYKTPQILMPENTNKDKVSNYSMAFDGVDDVITLSSSIINASEFSISIWIKPDGFSSSQIILGNGASSNNWIHLSSTTLIRIKIDTTLMNFTESGGNDLIDGVWQHLLIYRDSSNNVGIYRNGVAFSSTQSNTDTLELITIGKRGSLEYFGNIDDVAFWNTDESSSVSSIYNSGTPSTISGAVAHWKLGEQATFSTNWIVPDQVGSNDGTSANMTIEDREGNAPNSDKNALSYNMVEADIETDVPT